MTTICDIVFYLGLLAAPTATQVMQHSQAAEHNQMMHMAAVDDVDDARFEQELNVAVERESGRTPEQLLLSHRMSEVAVEEQNLGLFTSAEDADFSEIEWSASHQHQTHDCDRCCPTRVYHKRPMSLQNTRGEYKLLVHLSKLKKFQFLRMAECVRGSGSCAGRCQLEMMTTYLLVWNLGARVGPLFTIDRFEVPGYCSCKR